MFLVQNCGGQCPVVKMYMGFLATLSPSSIDILLFANVSTELLVKCLTTDC